MGVPIIKACVDPALQARLVDAHPLLYRGELLDLHWMSPHVQAASGIRFWGRRLVVIQDDVRVLAVQSDAQGFRPVLIPAGKVAGTPSSQIYESKKSKMDLEACVVIPDGRLVAFGSGSSPKREQIVHVDPSGEIHVRNGADLYSMLRASKGFSGSELNIEGAVIIEEAIRLFQRCNGAPKGDLIPVNATGDLPLEPFLKWLHQSGPLPQLERVIQYDLGDINGVKYGFTDATDLPDGRITFIACAEDSPDTVCDGEILGACFGVFDHNEIRISAIEEESGKPMKLKIEGIEWIPGGENDSFYVVADMDNPDEPAILGKLKVSGLFN